MTCGSEKVIPVSAKTLYTCIAVVLCFSFDVYAIDLMGPPTATHKALQVSLGLEYSYSEESVNFTDRGPIPLDTLRNVRRNTVFGRLGMGVLDYVEFFFLFGAGTLQANQIDFDTSADSLWGGGAKVTFYKRENIDLGALFQWSTFKGDETGFIDAYNLYAWEQIIVDEQHLAIGATVHMDGWRLYGGPFYYVFDGDVTIKEIGNPRHQIRPDMEEESEYGGYIGSQFDLGEAGFLAVEYVTTGEGWGAGIGLTWMF
ncbi:MAG: hypothetical protein ACYS7Y_02480 [Planctomycetota bacterium]